MKIIEWWLFNVRNRNRCCRGSPRGDPWKRPPSFLRRRVLSRCGANAATGNEVLKNREVIG